MLLGIILNTNNPETAWNAMRLGNEAIEQGNKVSLFLLGSGVELEQLADDRFDIPAVLRRFLDSGGKMGACGTCLNLRHQAPGTCPVSTMSELVEMISQADKVVTLG